MAAPLTPSRKTNINIGSSIMFVTSPATIVDKIKKKSEYFLYVENNQIKIEVFQFVKVYQWHIKVFLYP